MSALASVLRYFVEYINMAQELVINDDHESLRCISITIVEC